MLIPAFEAASNWLTSFINKDIIKMQGQVEDNQTETATNVIGFSMPNEQEEED